VIAVLRDFLVREEAPFTVTAAQLASVAGGRLARVVILRDGEAYMLAVLPAAAALDLAGFRRRSGRYGLTLAKEHEFRAEFPELAAGPLSPFGRMVAIPVYLDRALADETVMRFKGDGDREVVSLPMREYVRVERPAIAPLAQALRAA
jgi:Ala-tRNA(Pro) deacylase